MWSLVGHESAVRELDRSLKGGRLAHAYLFAGPPHVGKMTLATRLAQAVNCLAPGQEPCEECSQCRRIAREQHPDIVHIGLGSSSDGRAHKAIGIDEIRDLQHAATLMPYEGRCRVFIVDGAERMSEEASNALLKILEEPPPQCLLLLLSSYPDTLLPTVLSRCRLIQLRPLPLETVTGLLLERASPAQDEAQRLARLSLGCPGWALSALEDPSILERRREEMGRIAQLTESDLEERFEYAMELANAFFKDREESLRRLSMWLQWWRDVLLVKADATEYVIHQDDLHQYHRRIANLSEEEVVTFIKAIRQTIAALEANANPRLALEVMMLKMPETTIGQRE